MNNPLADYERLQRKLRKVSEGSYISKITPENYSKEKAILNSSSKHHYLPEYYIKGFLAKDGLLDIYDKERGAFKKKRRSSGSVFFEYNRNSTDFGFSKPVSLIEEGYGIIDNLLPSAIRLLRAENVVISEEIFIELMAMIDVFMIDLFWRNINTDSLFDDMYNRAKMTVTVSGRVLSPEETSSIKNEPGSKQLARFQIFKVVMQEALKQDPQGIKYGNLISYDLDYICLGDMPFLFPRPPKTQTDLLQFPVIIPISNSKIYLRNVERKIPYSFIDICMMNALIIDQSSKLICSSNPTILKKAVDSYRFAKEKDYLDHYRNKLFYNS